MQVQASLGTLHRAIDRALSLHDYRADRRGDTGRDCCDAVSADPDSDAAQEPAAALETRSILAPAPATADLVFSPAAACFPARPLRSVGAPLGPGRSPISGPDLNLGL